MKHLCLNCENAEMVRAKKDAVIEYRGKQAKVRAVDGWHCPECGEIEFAGKEGERYAEALEKLRAKMLDVFWDREKRTPIMKELYAYTMSQVWYLSMPSPWLYKIYQPWLKNYDAEPAVGYHGKPWRFVWIDQDLRKKLGF